MKRMSDFESFKNLQKKKNEKIFQNKLQKKFRDFFFLEKIFEKKIYLMTPKKFQDGSEKSSVFLRLKKRVIGIFEGSLDFFCFVMLLWRIHFLVKKKSAINQIFLEICNPSNSPLLQQEISLFLSLNIFDKNSD